MTQMCCDTTARQAPHRAILVTQQMRFSTVMPTAAFLARP